MFHELCLQNCPLMLLAVYLFKTGADSQCVGDSHPLFRQNYYKTCPKLNKMVQTVIKTPNLIEGCTMVYESILGGEPPVLVTVA